MRFLWPVEGKQLPMDPTVPLPAGKASLGSAGAAPASAGGAQQLAGLPQHLRIFMGLPKAPACCDQLGVQGHNPGWPMQGLWPRFLLPGMGVWVLPGDALQVRSGKPNFIKFIKGFIKSLTSQESLFSDSLHRNHTRRLEVEAPFALRPS